MPQYKIALNNDGEMWMFVISGGGLTSSQHPIAFLVERTTDMNRILVASTHTSMYIEQDGQAWMWGYNAEGSLGNNSTADVCVPVAVCGEHFFVAISSNEHTVLALDNYQMLWWWGGMSTSCVPIAVYGDRSYNKVAAGYKEFAAIDGDGQAWTWGWNTVGQLGNNTLVGESTPIAVYGGHIFCQISVGNNYMLAVDNVGNGWAWGLNTYGELGNNSTVSQRTPVAVCMAALSNGFEFIDANVAGSGVLNSSAGIDGDGNPITWGYNGNGKLGINSTVNKSTPTVITGHAFCAISVGGDFMLGIEDNGTGYAWGSNNYGQLGRNNMIPVSVPSQICNAHSWSQINAGYRYSLGLDKSGNLWSWGNNETYGKLGQGFASGCKSTPIAVCYP